MKLLDQLEATAKEATPGPISFNGIAQYADPDMPRKFTDPRSLGPYMRKVDADYITNCSPETILALVGVVRAAKCDFRNCSKSSMSLDSLCDVCKALETLRGLSEKEA